ncbi:MAG: hypothetical protein JO102_03300 [Elusimicrobia bacterium]|nr:hypothetical protein [Elusimicrobiota bacterium]
MNDSLADLVKRNVIDADEALMKTVDKTDLLAKLQGSGTLRPAEPAFVRAA